MISNKMDLKIQKSDSDGNVTWTFSGITQSVVGKEKLAQMYCKYLYGTPGNLLQYFKENNLSKNTRSQYIMELQKRVVKAGEHLKKIQKAQSLHDDEILDSVSTKNIDIQITQGIINLEIQIVSKSGATQIVNL